MSKAASTALHHYSAIAVDAFERRMGIRLPEPYKRYIMEVGAGDFSGSRLSLLEEWSQPYDERDLPTTFLSDPFPYGEAWNDLSLFDRGKGWRSAYYDPILFRGSMRVSNIGCEAYYLLVVSGDEYGNIWVDDRARAASGIYPLERARQRRVSIEQFLYDRL